MGQSKSTVQHERIGIISSRRRVALCLRLTLIVVMSLSYMSHAISELKPPDYYECRLDSIFPAGGQQGTTVTVELHGRKGKGGLAGPQKILIEGPPGITVSDLKAISKNNTVQAKFTIANDAPPGRRWVRVINEQSGITNFGHFVVSRLSEHIEKEPNNELDKAESLKLPVVVNGQINPKADMDCFRFSAKQGQKLVIAVAAHSIDVHGSGSNWGITDFTLELLDEQGVVIAESLDELGYDPMIHFEVPTSGVYTARLKLVAYNGYPEAVYRLTIGEVPYVTSVFPPGIQRGKTVEVELRGPNVPAGTRQLISANEGTFFPLQYLALPGATSGQDVPVLLGDDTESIESEPNNELAKANDLEMEAMVYGQFESKDDADWYRIRLQEKESVFLQVFAHRFIRSPVDTYLEVFSADGKLLSENDDDGSIGPGFAAYHDFNTTDSGLVFQPKTSGDYYVRVTNSNGTSGSRAVYRLSMKRYGTKPRFALRHFPDAVPIWGPGSTAGLTVRVDWMSSRNFDIDLSIEGLPDGWKGSQAKALGTTKERPKNPYQDRVFLTITAPKDVPVGTTVPFRVVGRVKHKGEVIERVAYPLTWFRTSDTGFFRVAPQAYTTVAKPRDLWLESMIKELTITQGETAKIPVRVHGAANAKEVPLVVNLAEGIKCNLGTPVNIPLSKDGIVNVPLVNTSKIPVGTFAITVAQTWRSDIRVGAPGPCTPIIQLHVRSKKQQ